MKYLYSLKSANGKIDIKEVKSSRDITKFIVFPNSLYIGNKSYVPSLLMDERENLTPGKNPAYEYCDAKMFMAYRGNTAVGRVLAIHNKRFNSLWNRKCIRFSRFDVIEDFEVAKALIDAVEKWAEELGMNEVQGPMGFCDLDKEGLLVDGFDERGMFITAYNHKYYGEFIERLGYSKIADWVEREIKVPDTLDPRIEKIAEYSLKKTGLHMLDIKKAKDILPYADGIFEVLEEAYRDLYGVIPLNEKQTKMYLNQFITLVRPEFIAVILDKNDRVVSFGVAVPSMAEAVKKCGGKILPFGWVPLLKYFTSKHCDIIEFLLIGTRREYWGDAVNANIMTKVFYGAKKYNVKFAETGPMLETNFRIHSMWKRFENRAHKRRRCYAKKLDGTSVDEYFGNPEFFKGGDKD